MEKKPRITLKNFCIWFADQVKRKRAFYNFFISHNAFGAFSINSHIRASTGQPKVTYNTAKSAIRAAEKMSQKYGKHFSTYKCLFCNGYHVGKNADNK